MAIDNKKAGLKNPAYTLHFRRFRMIPGSSFVMLFFRRRDDAGFFHISCCFRQMPGVPNLVGCKRLDGRFWQEENFHGLSECVEEFERESGLRVFARFEIFANSRDIPFFEIMFWNIDR
jgi:hypothetical protein